MLSAQWLLWTALSVLTAQAAWAVSPSCTATASGISFGSYKAQNPAVAFTGSIRVLCIGGAATFTIALTGGSSGNIAARTMRTATATLNYQLYSDPSHTTLWGDGSVGSIVGPITGSVAVVTVYGLLFAGQHVPPGLYADVIQAIVSY